MAEKEDPAEMPAQEREIRSGIHASLKQALESEAQAKLARAQIEELNSKLVMLGRSAVFCW